MTVKKWVIGVVAVCIGSPFAVGALGLVGLGPGFHIEVPEWEAGYEWRYDSITGMKAGFSGMGMTESESFEIHGATQRVVANTTTTLDDVPLYAVTDQYRPKFVKVNGDVVYEGDGTEQDAGAEFGWLACNVFCVGEYGYYTQEHLNPFYPGHGHWESESVHLLDFPLTRKSWTVSKEISDWDDDVRVVFEIEARAVGKGYVNLPGVGTMEAVRIEAGFTQESMDSIKRALRLDMVEDMPGLSVRFDLDFGMTYWFAPEARQIVRMETSSLFDVRLSFEGESIQMREEMKSVETLSGYSLEAGKERSLEEIQRINRLLDDIPEVRELSNVSWPFALAASTFSVDAVKGDTVKMGLLAGSGGGDVISDSFDQIPTGMEVEWRHRYLAPEYVSDGGVPTIVGLETVVERYSGATLELPIDVQGLHEVTAYLLDKEGKLVGVDSMILEGRGVWHYDANLPVNVIGLMGSHQIRFDTNLFLKEVEFFVNPGDLGQGSAEWYGVQGGQFSVSGETRETVKIGSPEQSFGPWLFEYHDLVRVDALKISVEARYDRALDPSHYFKAFQPRQVAAAGLSQPMALAPWLVADDECRPLLHPCGLQGAAPSLSATAERFGLKLAR